LRVLTVAAHPDDVEVLCAGTLGLLADEGHELSLAHMTVGDKGTYQDPEQLTRTRRAEAETAARLLGAQVYGGISGDLELYLGPEHGARVAELLAATAPDVVITHSTNDYHADHRVTAQLVRGGVSAFDAGAPSLVYMDTVAGIGFVPERYADITGKVELKKQMLRCHASQIAWMSSYRGTDLVYMIEWIGRWRGLQCGSEYGEGFRLDDEIGDGAWPRGLLDIIDVHATS